MIPVATTTISVKRSATAGDWDPSQGEQEMSVLSTGVRAVIRDTSGRSEALPGETSTIVFELVCDQTEMTYLDTVVDDTTGDEYLVDWARYEPGLMGLSHTKAGLRQVTGPGTN